MRKQIGKFIVDVKGDKRYEYILWASIFKPQSDKTLGGIYFNVPTTNVTTSLALLDLLVYSEDINICVTRERVTNRQVYRWRKFGDLNVHAMDRLLSKLDNFHVYNGSYIAQFQIACTFRDLYNEAILDGL